MTRKILSIGLVLFICISLFGTVSVGASTDGYYTYTISYGQAMITDVDTSASGDIIIPSTLGGAPVAGIDYNAFEDCVNVTSLTIPASVSNIYDASFRWCTSLENIFVDEENYTYFSIDGVLFKRDAFFETVYSLICYPSGKIRTSYTIPDGTESISSYAIISNYLENITINKDLLSLSTINCPNLKTISVESGNTSFKVVDGVLFDASGYTIHFYPAGKTDKSYIVPDNVMYIVSYAFCDNTYLENLVIPRNFDYFHDGAFLGCSNLKTVTLPDSIHEIGYDVFKDCVSLETVYYEGTEEDFKSLPIYSGNNYFKNAAVVYNYDYDEIATPSSPIYSYTLTDGKAIITGLDALTSVDDLIIPGTLDGYPIIAIGDSAFKNFINLTSVTIPDGVTQIGNSAFSGCSILKSVIIPESVTHIGNSAFSNCYKLTDITLPDSVTHIGGYIFYECESLTNMIIPDGITNIAEGTFSNCTNLTSVTIPASVINIDHYAFNYCVLLEAVYYNGTLAGYNTINKGKFGNDYLNRAEKICFYRVTFEDYSMDYTGLESGYQVILALYQNKRLVDAQPVGFNYENIDFTSVKPYDRAQILVWKNFIPMENANVLTK